MSHIHKNTWFTLSNMLTTSRIICAPIIAFYIIHGTFSTAFIIFALAALTDTIDGRLARARNTQTLLGQFLDPVADKVLMITTFGALVVAQTGMSLWFFVFLASREILLVLGAIFLLCTGRAISIQPSIWGKTTTFLQILLAGLFFLTLLTGFQSTIMTNSLLALIILFSLIAFGDYSIKGFKNNYLLQ